MAKKKIAIACQGGGSHTAFTAGVLKTFLQKLDPRHYEIVGLSGTSGGAMCAVLAWYGLLTGDRAKSITLLEDFWREMSAESAWDKAGNDWLVWLNRMRTGVLIPEISPYELPTQGQEKLAATLEKFIPFADLEKLVSPKSPNLLIGAVNARTGEFTVFQDKHPEKDKRITVKALLASAALPTLFRAVHIGKDFYWDGLFSENPPIRGFLAKPVSMDKKPDEIWIIRINPETRSSEPKSMNEIDDRRNELAGNLSLNQEVLFLNEVNDWLRRGWLTAPQFKHVDVRWIPMDLDLDEASKLDRNATLIQRLMQYGESRAIAFLHHLKQKGARKDTE